MNTERALKFIKNKKLLTVAGAILLGVIGNGLWEYVAKPLLFLSRDTLLNVATFGIHRFKDDCYRLIARGFTESASLSLLSEFNILYITASLIFSLHFYLRLKEAKEKKKKLDEKCNKCLEQGGRPPRSEEDGQSIEDLRSETARLLTRANVLLWAFIVITLFIISSRILTMVKYNYVNSAISHYKQIVSTCRPYITEEESYSVESKFSQVSSKDDYASLMAGLYEVCDKNKIKCNRFTPW